eukprot:TRINITY_DN4707_c0_g1_i1.p1 TRINITY_DN4707_c0_g1~~TRINITY_DN4707_c0_g1_i1.p1  ORF type:complete len:829 (-),score=133.27 TRINITY_DN4707_c0_g1_i1:26-2512(-)
MAKRSELIPKILWSPFDKNKFVVGSKDLIRTFTINEEEHQMVRVPQNHKTVEEDNFSLCNICTDIRSLQYIEWQPDAQGDHDVVAVGDGDGTVSLISFGNDSYVVKEFVLQQRRMCNALSWNTSLTHLLAAGYVKHRDVNSTIIWDINRQGVQTVVEHSSSSRAPLQRVNYSHSIVPTPEATVDLSWLPSKPFCIATGAKSKFLRFYDIRTSNPDPYISIQAHSRHVCGVKFDPFDDNILLTFSENTIKFWDIRSLQYPVNLIDTLDRNLTQVDWCPTMKNTVAVSSWSKSLTILELEHGNSFEEIGRRRFNWDQTITSFSWHPTDKYSIIMAGNSRDSFKKTYLYKSSPMGISNTGEIGVVSSKDSLLTEGNPLEINGESYSDNRLDISEIMYNRVLLGYSTNLERNMEIMSNFEPEICSAWIWMKNILSDTTDNLELPGIYRILLEGHAKRKVPSNIPSIPIYISQERLKCQKICGWDFYSSSDSLSGVAHIDEFIEECQCSGDIGRAAAIAVFNNCIPKAIEILVNYEAEPELKTIFTLVGLALSSYSENNETGNLDWKRKSYQIKELFDDPYIESIFSFLSATEINVNVLSKGVSLNDKIAFSCRYLSDNDLNMFLKKEKFKITKNGNLEGLIITGIDESGEGVELLKNYIDTTGDLQTVALLMSKLGRNYSIIQREEWINTYRELLNQWQMWNQRTKFDVKEKKKIFRRADPHVESKCSYCGKPFAKIHYDYTSVKQETSNTIRAEAGCCECGSSLPSCSLCLLPIFSIPFQANAQHLQMDPENSFTWCQSCQHGGHIYHILEWFEHHNMCPVPDCNCACMDV